MNLGEIKRLCVVAPHPDDESYGCGGLLALLRRHAVPVHWIIVTEMRTDLGFSTVQIDKRTEEIAQAQALFGIQEVISLGFGTTTLSSSNLGELANNLREHINRITPSDVILPFRSDAHSDHRIIFEAAFGALKNFRCPYVKRVFMMEIPSETDQGLLLGGASFAPNLFVDISETFNDKLKAVKIFSSELGEHPFPRSLQAIESLAMLRGSLCGAKFAEAFEILRWIV